MARCGCGAGVCSCVVKGSGGVTVTGAGSVGNPYLVASSLALAITDTPTVNLTLTGDGSVGTPYNIMAALSAALDDLADVDSTSATTGQVLAKQADGMWRAVPPSTATPGALTLLSTGGLQGDGSSGSPLAVKLAPSSGLTLTSAGLAAAGAGVWSSYTPVWTASTTNPTLGNGTLVGSYTQNGKTVHVGIELVIGSTTKRGVGNVRFTLPVAPVTTRRQVLSLNLLVSGVIEYTGTAVITAGRIDHLAIATSTAANSVSHATPATLPAGSAITMSGTYEAA